MTPGGAVTFSGEVVTLPSPTPSPTTTESGSGSGTNTIMGTRSMVTSTISLNQQGGEVSSLVIAGHTLTAGGVITVGPDVLSLVPGGLVVVSTVTVQGVAPTASVTGKKNLGRRRGVSRVRLILCGVFVLGIGVY